MNYIKNNKSFSLFIGGIFLLIFLLWQPFVAEINKEPIKNDIDAAYGLSAPTLASRTVIVPTKIPITITPTPEEHYSSQEIMITPVPVVTVQPQQATQEERVTCALKTGTFQLPVSWCDKYKAIDASAPEQQAYTVPASSTTNYQAQLEAVMSGVGVQDLNGLIEQPIQIVPAPTSDCHVRSVTGEIIGGCL